MGETLELVRRKVARIIRLLDQAVADLDADLAAQEAKK